VALGDSFHDPDAMERITAEDRSALAEIVQRVEFVWVSGNHETRRRKPTEPSCSLMPMLPTVRLGGVRLQHQSGDADEPEISGHFHPSASIRIHGRRVTRRCFVTDGRRMILPAFGCYTGGLDVGHPVLRARFPGGFTALLLGHAGVHRLPSSVLTAQSGDA
jgi:metallophosphoesterase superfamily enzyme